MSQELIELPEGWAVQQLGEICNITSSKRIFQSEYTTSGIPFYRTKEIKELAKGQQVTTELFISGERYQEIKVNFGIPIEGDMLLTAIGTIGEIYIVEKDKEFYFKDGNVLWLKDFQYVNTYYLKFALGSFIEEIKKLSSGSTYNALPIEKLKNHKIPLPPLNEQKRIVAKIEELNDRTQKAKEALDSIPQLCDRFRQSVLTAAFRGDLTADWREQNPDVEPASVLLDKVQKDKEIYGQQNKYLSLANVDKLPQIPETWIWCATENLSTFESNAICAGPFGTIFKAKDFRDSGIPIIFLRHVGEGKYLTHKPGFMDVDKWQEIFQPYSVWGGELLITKLGEPPGICAIYPKGIGPAMVTPDVIKMSVNNSAAETTYLMHYFNSRISKSFAFGSAYGVTRLRLNLPIFRQMPVPLAPFREQQEIICRIQSLFKAADTIEQQYQKSKARLDQLNQSILAKAFRGELVLQDPDDEPASVLLERIRAEREKLNNSKPKSKRTSKPKSKTPQGQVSIPGLE